MIRCLVAALFAVLFALPAVAGDYPINQRPMYGGAEKTPAMLEADDLFIKDILDQGISREEGARRMSVRGWQAFTRGDMPTAVKRFNQSWLLARDVYSTYWGFALVYLLRDNDVPNASAMFEKALSLGPDQGRFYVEYGRFIEETDPAGVDRAIGLFETGIGMDPTLRDGYIGLIRAYVRKQDPAGVRAWFERAKARHVLSPEDEKLFESAVAAMEKGGKE